MVIRCLIIDDEPLARQLLESYVQQVKSLQLIQSCSTAIEAFEVLHQQEVDLMFLDIQMPGINGLNFLKSLKQPPKVIFTTAYMEHAVEAFELEALDYLLKPVTFERFIKAIQKVQKREESNVPSAPATDPVLFIKENKRLVRIEHNDIIYLEGFGDYVKVATPNQVHVTYSTLNKLGELLPTSHFIRIHRSYIINLNKLQFLEGNYVQIAGHSLPIGLTYKEALLLKLNQQED
jgi:DNA-binding LytR/AlgR family response regulator